MESSFWIEKFIIIWLYLHWACVRAQQSFFFWCILCWTDTCCFNVFSNCLSITYFWIFFLLKLYLHCTLESLKLGCSSLLLIILSLHQNLVVYLYYHLHNFFNDYLSPKNCKNVFSFFLFPNLGYIIISGGFKYYVKDFFPQPIITYFLDMHIFRPL
jgi:hypothetical protein